MTNTIDAITTIEGPAAWFGRDLQDDDSWIETRLWLTLHEGRPIPDDFGRGYHQDSAGRGGIPAVPDRAEPLAGTYR